MNLQIKLVIISLIIICTQASLSLLGIRSGSLHPESSTNEAKAATGPVTFSVDTKDKDVTRLVGSALQFDVDSLQVAALDGLLKLSNSHAHFQKGNGVWKTTAEENTVGYYHNNRNFLFVDVSGDTIEHAKFKFSGTAAFGDISITGERQHSILTNLCRADRTLTPLPVGVIDPVANEAAIDRCSSDMTGTQLSISDIQDYMSKLLITAASLRNSDSKSLFLMQESIANITSAVAAGTSKDAPEEKERLHSVMAGFEAVVDALRLELTGKFKNLHAGFNTLQGEWASVDGRFEALDTNLNSRLSSSVAPIHTAVQNQATYLIGNISVLNNSLEESLQSRYGGVVLQLAELNNTLVATRNDLIVFNESSVHLGDYLNRTVVNITLSMDDLERRLTENLTNSTSRLEAPLLKITSDTHKNFQELAVNVSATSVLLQNVSEKVTDQHWQLKNVTTALDSHQVSLSQLMYDIDRVDSSAAAYTNTSVAALQEEVMIEFGHVRRESAGALQALNTSLLSLAERTNAHFTSLEADAAANISKVLIAANLHFDEVTESMKEEWLNKTNEAAEKHQRLLVTLQTNMNSMRTELENATLSFYNSSSDAIAELITNTSQVLARSNSIFARAIGEVNSTLLSSSTNLSVKIDSVRSDVEDRIRVSFAEFTRSNDATHAELEAEISQRMLNAESLLHNTTAALHSALEQQVMQVNGSLHYEVTRWTTEREVDHRAAAESAAALATLSDQVSHNHQELKEDMTRLNVSTATDLLALANKVTGVEQHHASALINATMSVTSDCQSKLSAVEEALVDKIQETSFDLEDFIFTRTRELTQSLSTVNATFMQARLEDAARVDSISLRAENAVVAVKESVSVLDEQLHFDLNNLNISTASSVNQLSIALSEAIQALDIREVVADAKLAAELNRTAAAMYASIREAEAKGNANTAFVERQMHLLNSTVKADFIDFGDQLRVGIADARRLSQSSLELESARLSSAINSSAHTAAEAAHTALNMAVSDLRSVISQTKSSLVADSEHNYRNISAQLSDAVEKQENDKQHLDRSLQLLSVAVIANVTALQEADRKLSAEQQMSLTSLNSSLYNTCAEGTRRTNTSLFNMREEFKTMNASTTAAISAVTKRIDSTDDNVQAVAHSLSAQVSATESSIRQQAHSINSTLHSKWNNAVQELYTVKDQAHSNITKVHSQLEESLREVSTQSVAGLNRVNASLCARVDRLAAETNAGLMGAREELADAVNILNKNAQSESKARLTTETSLSAEIKDVSEKETVHYAEVGKILNNHSVEISANKDAVAQQHIHLIRTLANFSAEHSASNSQILHKVDVRVQEAEVQVRLNNVALDAVRNDTNRLSNAVRGFAEKVSGVEVGAAAVQVEVTHCKQQQSQLARSHENITAHTIPAIFSKLGALEFAAEEQAASFLRIESESRTQSLKVEGDTGRIVGSLSALEKSVENVSSELSEAKTSVTGAVHQLQQQYLSVAVKSNATSAQFTALSTAVENLNSQVSLIPNLQMQSTNGQQRLTAVEERVSDVDVTVKALKSASEEASVEIRELLRAQAAQVRDLEAGLKRQQQEILALQEENRRLVRESATVQSTDDLRRLLFDLQGQMLTHSSKVLDLLLQPRSAVLVHPPAGGTQPPSPPAAKVVLSNNTSIDPSSLQSV